MTAKFKSPILEYFLIFIIVTLMLVNVYDLSVGDLLSVPLAYHSDALDIIKRLKLLIGGEWQPGSIAASNHLGAPYSYYDGDFPQPIPGQLLVQKITGAIVGDAFAAFNIYVVSSFYLAALSMHWVLKRLGAQVALSLTLSIVFAFLPFHYIRIVHTNYVQYFYLPIIVYLVLQVWEGTPIFFEEVSGKVKLKLSTKNLAKMAVIGFFGVWNFYYTFFLSALIIVSAVVASFTSKKLVNAVSGLIFLVCFLGPFAVSYYPYVKFKKENSENVQVAVRSPAESIKYGLMISDTIFPVNNHRIDSFNAIREKYNATTPLRSELNSPTLGAIASLGFLLLILFAFIPSGGNLKLQNLSKLNLACLLVAIPGGFGSVFAYLISPQIRGYDRISIIIATMSLFSIALCWSEFSKKRKLARVVMVFAAPLLLAFAVYDQIPPQHKIKLSSNLVAKFKSDKIFIGRIESALGENNKSVFQLPYACTPECLTPVDMDSYSHITGYLHSKAINWSYGGTLGRISDAWYHRVAQLPVSSMVAALTGSGFSGIYIDRLGYKDRAAHLESEIQNITRQPPFVSPDNNKSFFKIQPTGNNFHIFNDVLGRGFYGWEAPLRTRSWSKQKSELHYSVLSADKHAYIISFALTSLTDRSVIVDGPQGPSTYVLSPNQATVVTLEIDESSEQKPLTFSSVQPAAKPGNGDPRELAFAIGNLSIIEKDTGRDLIKLSREALK